MPLPALTEDSAPALPHQDATARAWEATFMHLATHLFRVLPQWESLVWGPEIPPVERLEKCEALAKDFFHRTFEISSTDPSHIRLRLMLSQLYISLRDTVVLMHDPKRYITAFSKVDPKGLMFQAEVLSLHEGGAPTGSEGNPPEDHQDFEYAMKGLGGRHWLTFDEGFTLLPCEMGCES
jgi:hypothetical protein